MNGQSRGERFTAAFNDIEDEFRRVLGRDTFTPFVRMARMYADRQHLPPAQLDALQAFAALRNAISHARFYGGQPIAEPVEAVVTEIEWLRDQIRSPREALSILPQRQVCTASPGDPIGTVLKNVVDFDYSQVPVYDGPVYVGILTTNAVARWAARRLAADREYTAEEPVGRVLDFAEPHERALFIRRTITAAEAVDQLTHGGKGGTPVTALIATHDGRPTGRPIRIITSTDLPALSAALGVGPS